MSISEKKPDTTPQSRLNNVVSTSKSNLKTRLIFEISGLTPRLKSEKRNTIQWCLLTKNQSALSFVEKRLILNSNQEKWLDPN